MSHHLSRSATVKIRDCSIIFSAERVLIATPSAGRKVRDSIILGIQCLLVPVGVFAIYRWGTTLLRDSPALGIWLVLGVAIICISILQRVLLLWLGVDVVVDRSLGVVIRIKKWFGLSVVEHVYGKEAVVSVEMGVEGESSVVLQKGGQERVILVVGPHRDVECLARQICDVLKGVRN